MLGAIVWGLLYFIFIKTYCSIAFYNPLSLVAALLIAVLVSLIEVGASYFYAGQLGKYLARNRLVGHDDTGSLWKIIGIWILTLPIVFLVSVFVTIGFSEKFYKQELRGSYRELLDWDNAFIFFLGLAIMCAANLLVFILAAQLQGKSLREP